MDPNRKGIWRLSLEEKPEQTWDVKPGANQGDLRQSRFQICEGLSNLVLFQGGKSQGPMVRRYAKLNLALVGRESVGHGVVTRTYKPSGAAEREGEEKCRRVLSSSPAWAMQRARSQSELHCKILSQNIHCPPR